MDQATTDSLKRLTDRLDALEKFKTDSETKLTTQTQRLDQLDRETGSGRNTFTNTATGLTEAQIALQNLKDTYDTFSTDLSAFIGISLDTDGTLAANSDSRIATQKAVKTKIASDVAAEATIRSGADALLAALPTNSGGVPGDIRPLNFTAGSSYSLPSGGNWFYFYIIFNAGLSTGAGSGTISGVSAGGTQIIFSLGAGLNILGFAWRIN